MRFIRSSLYWFILLAGLCPGFAADLPGGELPALRLNPVAQVDSGGIFLNDIFQSDKPLPVTRLCDAPEFGKTAMLTRAQIAEFARVIGTDLGGTNWTGPESIRISRRARALAEADALTLLTGTLQREVVKDRGELELRFTHPWTAITVPDEPLTVRVVDLPTIGITPSFMARFELHTAHETVGTWQASFEAHIWRDVWVASAPLKRGDALEAGNITRERRNIISIHEALADFPEGDATQEIAQGVAAGSPLLARDVHLRPVVFRGQAADGVLHEGALTITMRVEVLEDGAPGQVIRLRNPQTRHDLRGKVINEQTVLMLL